MKSEIYPYHEVTGPGTEFVRGMHFTKEEAENIVDRLIHCMEKGK